MKSYLEYSRSPWFSFLLAVPLLVLYQTMVVIGNLGQPHTVINGADGMVQGALQMVGIQGWLGSWVVLALVTGVLVFRRDRAHSLQPVKREYFGMALVESTIYALGFGTVVAVLTSLILPGGLLLQIGGGQLNVGQRLAASLGAGLYEELVFRLFLTGGMIWVFRKLQWKEGPALTTAVLASSFIFSLVHYVGPLGDPFQIPSFTFRFVAGVVLTVLYALRGFGIAAWTHALYDVFLVALNKA